MIYLVEVKETDSTSALDLDETVCYEYTDSDDSDATFVFDESDSPSDEERA